MASSTSWWLTNKWQIKFPAASASCSARVTELSAPLIPSPEDTRPGAIVLADFNNDGKLDLAGAGFGSDSIGGNPGSVSILLGKGDGTFPPAVNYTIGSPAAQVSSITAGDLNGDGRPDLVALILDSDGGWKISMLAGNGDGTFGQPTFKPTKFGPNHAVLTDLNGDGFLDLVVAHCCGDTDATYLLANGDGTFQDEVHFLGGPSPTAIAVADFDGDGKPDLAIAGKTSNTGSGSVVTMLNKLGSTAPPPVQ